MSSRSQRASWRGSLLQSGQSHGYMSGLDRRPTLDDLAEDARGCHVGWWYDVLFLMMPCFHLFGRFQSYACLLQCCCIGVARPRAGSQLGLWLDFLVDGWLAS